MRKIVFGIVAIPLALIALTTKADELTRYVQQCETELGFAASEVPTLDCNDGEQFKVFDRSPVNDFAGHARINPNVDLVFACRWLSDRGAYSDFAVTIELLIHNRDNGATCFFEAKDTTTSGDSQVSTTIISPTDPSASSYWMQPKDLDAKKFSPAINGEFPNGFLRCVGCHVAGPYIASPSIAPTLAKFGLLNDGHDTKAERYYAVLPPPPKILGVPIGVSSFIGWKSIIDTNNSIAAYDGCASACHSIGTGSSTDALLSAANRDIVVPSLLTDIADVSGAGSMPANDPMVKVFDPDFKLFDPNIKIVNNSYRWVNMDVPDRRGDYEEHETLSDLKVLYPRFYCSNPISLSAHAIDSDEIINTGQAPDILNRFNLQDGLVCLNKDQPGGLCHNYQTRYVCSNGKVAAWQDNDDPSYSGDWEPRNSFKGLCSNPTLIQARYYDPVRKWVIFNGPPDRLVEFDNKGLVCHNADQNNSQCSNYVVRFECP